MVRPYSTSKHTSPGAVTRRLRTLAAVGKSRIYEVVVDSGSGSHSELIRSTSVDKAARKAAALHRMSLGPIVITADKPTDRTGYRVTFHGGIFGGNKEYVMYVSLARIQ